MAVAAAGFSVIGSVLGFVGGFMQANAAKKAEKARKRQMQLEASRRRRDAIRQGMIQRAQVVAAGAATGVSPSDSSVQVGAASATSQAGRGVLAANQDERLGLKVSRANQQFQRGGMIAGIGEGLSSLGGAVTRAGPTLARIGNFQLPTTQSMFGGRDNRAFTPG